MAEKAKKTKHQIELEAKLSELTNDLQRTRADFENYRKRVDDEKDYAKKSGYVSAVMKLLPVIDNIERAVNHLPDDLADNKWAAGVVSLSKNLDKQLESLGVTRIDAKAGTVFNPELHQAIQFDEESEGDHEVIVEELQPGYMYDGTPIRHAFVKVARSD